MALSEETFRLDRPPPGLHIRTYRTDLRSEERVWSNDCGGVVVVEGENTASQEQSCVPVVWVSGSKMNDAMLCRCASEENIYYPNPIPKCTTMMTDGNGYVRAWITTGGSSWVMWCKNCRYSCNQVVLSVTFWNARYIVVLITGYTGYRIKTEYMHGFSNMRWRWSRCTSTHAE